MLKLFLISCKFCTHCLHLNPVHSFTLQWFCFAYSWSHTSLDAHFIYLEPQFCLFIHLFLLLLLCFGYCWLYLNFWSHCSLRVAAFGLSLAFSFFFVYVILSLLFYSLRLTVFSLPFKFENFKIVFGSFCMWSRLNEFCATRLNFVAGEK